MFNSHAFNSLPFNSSITPQYAFVTRMYADIYVNNESTRIYVNNESLGITVNNNVCELSINGE